MVLCGTKAQDVPSRTPCLGRTHVYFSLQQLERHLTRCECLALLRFEIHMQRDPLGERRELAADGESSFFCFLFFDVWGCRTLSRLFLPPQAARGLAVSSALSGGLNLPRCTRMYGDDVTLTTLNPSEATRVIQRVRCMVAAKVTTL